MPLRSSRRNYNRIVANQDDTSDVTESNALDEPLSPSSSFAEDEGNSTGGTSGGDDTALNKNNSSDDTSGAQQSSSSPLLPVAVALPIENEISVILMDAAQSKFNIKCDPKWKVRDFKETSATITKVPPQSQRLIHMGKLLQDDSTLDDCGIKEDGKIIHLFPKPNVVINTSSSTNDDAERNDNTENGDAGGSGTEGAHIPQIILDAEEASRRSQILILSSQEIFEAQHRVKIFSFLLMIISSMELLTLMTLFVGMQAEDPTGYGGGSSDSLPPGNPTDAPPSSSGSSMQMRTWQNSDYFDTVISAFGFYVSLLGIKATTENTLALARQYFACLTLAGIGSNCYYYYLNIQAEQKRSHERNQPLDGSELYSTAFVGILLPLTVWLLCIIRAYQFQALIREAEVEAEERTRGLNNNNNGEGAGDAAGGGEEEGEAAVVGSRSLPYGSSDDLELAVEQGEST